MQVLVHVLVLERIMRRLLRRRDGGVQMLQLRREAHPDLERIGHAGWWGKRTTDGGLLFPDLNAPG